MTVFYYVSLLLAQAGISGKQYAMKHCGMRAPGPFNSICINLARAIICLVVSTCIWLAAGGGVTTPFGHLIIIVTGISTAFNLFTWILASRLVSLTLIESVGMIGTLITPLILAPYLYDGDSVSPVQWIGCVLVIVGAFCFMNKETGPKKEGSLFQKILLVTACTVCAGGTVILKKYYTFHVTAKGLGNIEYFTFINFVTILGVFLILFAFYYAAERKRAAALCTATERPHVEFPYKKVWFYILIAAASLYINELFTVYAAQLPSAIYYPLSKGLTVACSFLMDVLLFKDKVTVKKIIGLITVIIAIVLVNL